METAGDLMTPEPLKVAGDTPAETCRATMIRAGVRHLPSVDESGALIGMVTRYASALAAPGQTARDISVQVPTCLEDTPLVEMLRRLQSTTADGMVVVDRKRHPVGIVTEHDVIRAAPALLEGTHHEMVRGTRPLVTVAPTDSWKAAFDALVDNQIRHLPVVRDGAVIGVISLKDLLAAGVTRGQDGAVAELVGGRPVHAVQEGVQASRAAVRMAETKVGCLPLLGPRGQPVGMVTRSDVIDRLLTVLENA